MTKSHTLVTLVKSRPATIAQLTDLTGEPVSNRLFLVPSEEEFRYRVYAANYRARQHGLVGQLTSADPIFHYHMQRGRCFHCDRLLYPNADLGFEIDHLIAVSRNGAHTRENIVISCRHCNRQKGEMTLEQWIRHCAAHGIRHRMAYQIPDLTIQLPLGLTLEDDDHDHGILDMAA